MEKIKQGPKEGPKEGSIKKENTIVSKDSPDRLHVRTYACSNRLSSLCSSVMSFGSIPLIFFRFLLLMSLSSPSGSYWTRTGTNNKLILNKFRTFECLREL